MEAMTDHGGVALTSLAHGGGCGCKIAPGVLGEMLARLPRSFADPALLVALETGDDAAVYRLNESQAVVATTDFFMPIVDDPIDFGRIAATNALSDIYAIGGRPLFALAVVGMPIDKLAVDVIGRIMQGGAQVCEAAGAAVAGGHSIDSPEPIYGLAAIGLAHPDRIKRNSTARAGDRLILGKGLGVGILSASFKKGALDHRGYRELIETTTRLNDIGAKLAEVDAVHAMTDVTGFGLLGHLLEVCRGSGLAARIPWAALPILERAQGLARQGFNTGAAGRNWRSYGEAVTLPADLAEWQHNLLCDPQTSGGLLVAVAAARAEEVLALFHARGYAEAAIIGELEAGNPAVRVD
jgi:selenide,water dikinase